MSSEEDYNDELYDTMIGIVLNQVVRRNDRLSQRRRNGLIPTETPYFLQRTFRESILVDEIVDGFVSSIFNGFVSDPIDGVIARSFEEQKTLDKQNEEMKLTSVKYKDLSIVKETSCSVCLIDYEETDDISIIKCGHFFHTKCIQEWTTYKTNCPVCRKEIKEEDDDNLV